MTHIYDSVPVLAITGNTYSDLIGSRYQQDVDLTGPFSQVAGFNNLVMSAAHARMAVDIACKYAVSCRDVGHISIPIDVQEQDLSEAHVSEHKVLKATSNVFTSSVASADRRMVKDAASILSQGKKTVILVGAGALGAGKEVLELAAKLQAPVVKALLGKAVIPDESPYSLGGLGLLGTAPSEEAMQARGHAADGRELVPLQ